MSGEKQIDIIIDLLTEFDEMGFQPTVLHPNPEEYAIEWKRKLMRALEDYCKQEWISVGERLPEEDGKYLVYTNDGYIMFSNFFSYCGCVNFDNWKVTHWMPLPEAPKGGEE